LCDYDEGRRAPNYRGLCHVLRTLGFVPCEVRYSRTRKGWHVLIAHHVRLSPAETVCAQFALGSDRKRETLNLMRVLRLKNAPRFWRQRWNLLYGYKLR
jgi:hypothetical protein